MESSARAVRLIEPDSFDPVRHFYPRALNAQIHPLVRFFMSLDNVRLADRYCHLHPEISPASVHQALAHRTRFMRWGGADLLHATNEHGVRRLVLIETNSCPSGQKSMPLADEDQEQGGYRKLIEKAFAPMLKRRGTLKGGLAVLWDKNPMEVSGYASVIADVTGEPVHLVPFFADDPDPPARFDDGLLKVRANDGSWHPIRAAFRYVTQRPWDRIPPLTRTHMLNPVVSCLAGGRNKMLAAKAYDIFNAEFEATGLCVNVPETIWDVSKTEVPMWVTRMGGYAVIKDPYSNAGQGVWTVTNPDELAAFMEGEHRYDRFIVQALVGNHGWSSRSRDGRLYHVGTMPNRKSRIYVADLRFMVGVGQEGFFPVAMYARRARSPLERRPEDGTSSWDMLGTNLSVKRRDGTWDTESERLMLMDRRDFNHLGVGLDDLIEAYLQTVLAVSAIDRMAITLATQKGRFRKRFFHSINPDTALVEEICG